MLRTAASSKMLNGEALLEPLAKPLYLSVPHMGGSEMRMVQEAFETNWLSTVGPHIGALEGSMEDLLGEPSLTVASGTAALHLALRLVGVGPGDEVVTPTLSFAASSNAILYVGGRPVLMDSEPLTWNLDPELLAAFLQDRAKSNRLPKAVMVVHLFGQPAAMNEILSLCERYDLPLIEDAAESLGAQYHGKQSGTLGDVGVFSFNGSKVITGTTGGLLVSRRREWIERARSWSVQAKDPDPEELGNYVHSELGHTYAMSNVVAGIVRGQLEVLPERLAQRRAVFERYQLALQDLPGWSAQLEGRQCRHSRWLSAFAVDEQQSPVSASAIIRHLRALNVESRPVWRPMHLQPLYRGLGTEVVGGEVAERLNRSGICLPSSSSLDPEDQAFVIQAIRELSEGESR